MFLHEQVTTRLVTPWEQWNNSSPKILLGSYRPEMPESLDGIYQLEQTLNCEISLLSIYQAWGDGPDHQFPLSILRNMDKAGYGVMITWEPWLNAFTKNENQNPKQVLKKIAQGEYDYYIRAWARDAVRFGKPLLVRIAHEMTNPWYIWSEQYGNSPQDFQAMWLHIHKIFKEEKAHNIAMVWTPYQLEDHRFFPGHDYVDIIGFNIFNYGGLSEEGKWLDFYSITKLFVDSYKHLNKPLIISEVASSSAGGNKSDWIRDMFHSIQSNNFPELKAIVLFDHPGGSTFSGIPIDWSLANNPDILELFTTTPISGKSFILKRSEL
jgi:beta-mannanase